jgi:hypothetical protein
MMSEGSEQMNNKVAHTRLVLFAIAFLFFSCGLNPFPFDGDIPPTPNVLSKKDSLAVRAILDANGLDTVKVRDVVSFYNSVVVQINLNSRSLSQFVFNKNIDSLWNGCGLSLLYNNIDTLIFADSILNIFSVDLDHNKVRTIPDDIGKTRGPVLLYVNYNALSSVSPNILHCQIYKINVRYNHLVSVPDSIAALLTSKDSTWKNYQTP